MIKFCVCKECQKDKCDWFLEHDFDGVSCCCYEPDDLEGFDIGSAIVKEMRLQNGDF